MAKALTRVWLTPQLWSVLMDDPVTARQVGIIAIELGVGMAVCGALLSIFHAFAAREPR